MNRHNTVIESLGIYLPAQAVSTSEVIQGCANRVLFPLEQFSGIRQRRVAGEDEFSIDLAKRAIEDCLANSRHNPADIDLLICCNISRYDGPNLFSFEPSTSIKLKKHFGFDHALVFDISNACPGIFTAIHLVDAFLQTGSARCAMVVSGERITHLTQTAQKEIDAFMDPRLACLTLGDSGAAMILEQAEAGDAGLQAIELYTVGRYCSYCVAKATDHPHGGAIMLTDSIKLSAVTLRRAIQHTAHVAEQNHWPPDGFEHLIMHQTSIKTLTDATHEINNLYGKKICHDGNVIYNLAERGNTATTSHFVALWDNILNQRINSGDKILFSVTGSGVTIGTALYALDDLPDRLRRIKSGQEKPRKVQTGPHCHRNRQPELPRVRIESLGAVPDWRVDKKDTLELARIAAEECLEMSSYDRNEIDLLMFSGIYRSEFICEPAIAAFLEGSLQINDAAESGDTNKTLAFDVFNGGIAFLNACQIGVQMIQARKNRIAMIVASEVENNPAASGNGQRRGVTETGSAMILDTSPDGTGFGGFAVKYFTEHLDALVTYGYHANGSGRIHIEQRADLEESVLQCVPAAVQDALALEGLDLSQIKLILPPQLSTTAVSRLSKAMNVPRNKFVDLGELDSDLFSSSLVFGIQHARQEGLAKAGDIGLAICTGTGLQIGTAIYYF
jgi:3-oxoacyl-[acyl-carrier-protein] synthase III